MLERFREKFQAQPRIIVAYLVGECLTPEDGSAHRDASSIVLILDPFLDNGSPATLRRDISMRVSASSQRLGGSTTWAAAGAFDHSRVQAPS